MQGTGHLAKSGFCILLKTPKLASPLCLQPPTNLVSYRNTLRVTRSAALSSQDGSVGGSVYLGKKGKDFEFSQLPMKVEFLECSARGNKGEDVDADMEGLERSLAKL